MILKNNIINQLEDLIKKINNKNLPIKPNKGGTPAKEINNNVKVIEINTKFPQFFNSFNVRK